MDFFYDLFIQQQAISNTLLHIPERLLMVYLFINLTDGFPTYGDLILQNQFRLYQGQRISLDCRGVMGVFYLKCPLIAGRCKLWNLIFPLLISLLFPQ